VWDDHSTYNKIPHKFEAGTPNVEGAVGLATAITYLERIGRERIADHEQALAAAAIEKLTQIEGVTVYGPRGRGDRAGVVSFTYGDNHTHEIATLLDKTGIYIRDCHHCAQPQKLLHQSGRGLDDDSARQGQVDSPGARAGRPDERHDAGGRGRRAGQNAGRAARPRRRVEVSRPHQVRPAPLERADRRRQFATRLD